ncbi:glycoside hydrolase family 17 protein [Dothidotthia symphoricarpi CBS 119687]|uniref:glucan endo-1,3-beta-D-glucosidase n=1 Tax=Dothidotthia symphoricarpi CBS 119687 TaxID=1392245 RepID=A0A6A6A0X8_9PLEO|nr:glycoside hydrolase family 17 protein [Dothidotthia symphoricarpi CBS 119687]KAF2124211.1 glycoside hydrolase family 17 protein [Dothidotthia symphoricarpi CBS 119687]
MAQPQGFHEQPAQGPLAEGLSDDFAPPPPAHRVPVGMHADNSYQPHPQHRPLADPNDYSDYSTPGLTPGSDSTSDKARAMYSQRSYGSNAPLAPAAAMPAGMYAGHGSYSYPSPHGVPYSDSPYNRYSSSAQNLAPQMGHINPNEVADDDDWGLGPDSPQNKRRSRTFAPFGASRDASRNASRNGSPGSSITSGVGGAGVGAAAGAGAAAYSASSRDDGSGKYNVVPLVSGEKSDWQKEDHRARKKNMWIAIAIIVVILLGSILGGVLGSQLSKGGSGHKSQQDGGGTTPDDVQSDNKDDLSINSAEIKSLMNNQNLHKVFPGMDYTPLNTQYPDCLHVGPSQNNITRDLAVMSQLTNTVRVYGTDCNQTQMLIHAIDRLEIKDSMKIWLGVWLDSNDTTTTRQIDQTWTILDDYGCDYFKGIIIGNEVLYRKDLTSTQLLTHVTEFRQNITDHKCKLPVAMADLGDNWTADMATEVDIVMSNIHPFFSGTKAEDAAAWTWNFWQEKDVALTANNASIKQVIAEVGWPSGGGTNCGAASSCTDGSVAGITEMNRFMEDWICPSLKNETEYFWFSAFDEPWKVRYNEKGKEWEDKWGLMDIDRNLKKGLVIPDCDGQALPNFD